MKKLLTTLLCTIMATTAFAQTEESLFDFIRNAPWKLTDSEIQVKYQDNLLQIPDSISQLVTTAMPISPNIISGLNFQGIDTFIGYITDENTKTPTTFVCLLNPLQTTETNFIEIIDSALIFNFGKPIEKPSDIEDHKQLANDVTYYMSNMWEYTNSNIVSVIWTVSYLGDNKIQQTLNLYGLIVAFSDNALNSTSLDAYRVKFRGIPINGNTESFCKELTNIGYSKDYNYTPNGNTTASFTGFYGGEKCRLFVYATPITRTVYQVRVILQESYSWNLIKNTYYSFRNRFENKYGKPWMSEEKFEYPYEDGDGLELRSIERNKATFYATFNNTDEIGIGYVDIMIRASYNEGWVSIDFKDGQNMLLNESEMSDSL